jgi:hypothetical protein
MPPPMFTTTPFGLQRSETLDPPPPPPPPGRHFRIAARVVLWTLIGIAAIHGLAPPFTHSSGPGPISAPTRLDLDARDSSSGAGARDQAAMATAAAFLREYLTLDRARATRPARLKRYMASGVDLAGGLLAPADISQFTDSVLPARVERLPRGLEVTVIAHLLHARSGTAEDGGTVAFVVPLLNGPGGFAVSGLPRPAALPVDRGLTRAVAVLPTELARTAAVDAAQAVAALLEEDRATLARLGGGRAPEVRPFPSGWRPVGIADVRPIGPPRTPTVEVDVRARPPVAGVEYLVPVRVSLRSGTGGQTVSGIDAGGAP